MSKRFTLTFSDDLYNASQHLKKRRLYRSDSEYFAALVRYDGQSQRDHLLTAEWAALDAYERDRLDGAILRQVLSGEGIRGSWLEAKIREVVKEMQEAGKELDPKAIAKALAKKTIEGAEPSGENQK